MFNWLKSKFKSRAQKDRERLYYATLPRIGSAHKSPADQLDELLAEAHRTDRKRVPAPKSRIRPATPWARLKEFRRRYAKWPNPKECLAILFPSAWLMEKLWPKWDPEDRNARIAPPAGYYDTDTGRLYDHKHRYVRTIRR
jgi:hypothetical protein